MLPVVHLLEIVPPGRNVLDAVGVSADGPWVSQLLELQVNPLHLKLLRKVHRLKVSQLSFHLSFLDHPDVSLYGHTHLSQGPTDCNYLGASIVHREGVAHSVGTQCLDVLKHPICLLHSPRPGGGKDFKIFF